MIDLVDYIAAGILYHIANNPNSSFLQIADVSDVSIALSGAYNVDEFPEPLVGAALFKIIQSGGGEVLRDPFTRDYVHLTEDSCNYLYNDLSEDSSTPYGKAARVGRKYLEEAFLRLQELPQDDLIKGVYDPVSEAVVAELDQTSDEIKAISDQLTDLQQRLEEGNEAGAAFGDERDAVVAEVSALRRTWSSSKIRVQAFMARAQSTLSWIAEKAATTAVGELAKHILKALWTLFT